MLEPEQVPQLLVAACPAFEEPYREHVAEHGEDLLYVAAGVFAQVLLDLHNAGREDQLTRAAQAIERMHLEGTPWVQEFATIGLLEGIQNVWANRGTDPQLFTRYLGQASSRWWQGLNRFWEGKSPVVRGDA